MATKHIVEVLGESGWYAITGEDLTFEEAVETAQSYLESFSRQCRVTEVRRKVRWTSRKPRIAAPLSV